MINFKGLIGCVLLFYFSCAFANEQDLIFPISTSSSVELVFEKPSLDIKPEQSLKVFVGNSRDCCEGRSAMAGKYVKNQNSVIFKPAFKFEPGQIYTALTQRIGKSDNVEQRLNEFSIPAETQEEAPYIVDIYPSGNEIPENTLRFYINFSAPMQPHVSAQYIQLVDASGQIDSAAFMSFKQELWSEDRKRLTLLMDPGRIKRGVAQNLTLGPALKQGASYSIVIKEGWPNATGNFSLEEFTKDFIASPALRTLPDTGLWNIRMPQVHSSNPLVIEFDRPFDHELLKSSLRVLNDTGKPIQGRVSISNKEKQWIFTPEKPWEQTNISIVVNTRLEDVAGNNFRDLLDHSIGTELIDSDHIVLNVSLETK